MGHSQPKTPGRSSPDPLKSTKNRIVKVFTDDVLQPHVDLWGDQIGVLIFFKLDFVHVIGEQAPHDPSTVGVITE